MSHLETSRGRRVALMLNEVRMRNLTTKDAVRMDAGRSREMYGVSGHHRTDHACTSAVNPRESALTRVERFSVA
jgi:hypothetical protein